MVANTKFLAFKFLFSSLALPPFPPFPGAAYGPAMISNAMYRGGNLAQQPGRGVGAMQRVGGGGALARGFDNGMLTSQYFTLRLQWVRAS